MFSHLYCQKNISDVEFWMRYLSLSKYYPWNEKIPFIKCFDQSQRYNVLPEEHFLTFPHKDLKAERKTFDEYSHSPISKHIIKKYKKAKTFVTKLSTKNLCNEEWIEILFGWNDQKFAVQTIESKLALNFWDKDLWKSYIHAMKSRNLKAMHNILQRYTKLFLSDYEMQETYNAEILNIKSSNSDEYNNLRDITFYFFDDLSPKIEGLNIQLINPYINVKQQYYSLPEGILFYILDLSNAILRLNLFKSCKNLFIKKPTPICHHLEIQKSTTKYIFQSLLLQSGNVENNLNSISKLYITNRIFVKDCNIKMLKMLIPKMSQCDARFISITQQIITIKEYKFLVNPKKVEKLYFENGGITENNEEDGKVANLERILEALPNAYNIQISFNEKFILSPTNFSILEKNVKVKTFFLRYFNQILNLEDYCNFIKKYATPKSRFGLGFVDNIKIAETGAFYDAVNKFTTSNFDEKLLVIFDVGFNRLHRIENLENFT